jgi:hypothetical protein
MSRLYFVEARVSTRAIWGAAFLWGAYDQAYRDDWMVAAIFVVPGILATIAAVRLAILKLESVFWH